MGKLRIIFPLLALLFGIFLVIFGGYDDSPGGQLLGVIISIVASISLVRTMPGFKRFMHHFARNHSFDYTEVDDTVIIGTNMCCQVGFSRELLTKGIRADISLEGERVDAPHGVDYFLWLPTVNGEAPSPSHIELGIKALDFFISRGIKVYIHCTNGHGRAPTLYIAYLITKGLSVDDAIARVKERRPSIHLTESQMAALHKLSNK